MVKIVVAPALARWLPASAGPQGHGFSLDVAATRVDEALQALFEHHPGLRGYVLDEHGAVRHHVAVIVDGEAITDKHRPVQPLRDGSEVYIMQALSGG
ncbi:MoaD/ThiS family protein [Pseudoxanthomonas sp. SL93]|uniref:MoaD/ThiS family protein n=1 Tax=Pseudoxanthomonas sp. SL93 TaxID=2995142 RepID=UPI00226F34CE|nr:MoaD/ThiS family protein [Pseudoxanthomonas sp. SL93]WAC64708.1 MoaD/ThiS family protein [Pseudoxanthomonas sp. SL93]